MKISPPGRSDHLGIYPPEKYMKPGPQPHNQIPATLEEARSVHCRARRRPTWSEKFFKPFFAALRADKSLRRELVRDVLAEDLGELFADLEE